MGSPLAFEYRRQELLETGEGTSDEDVVASFLNLLKVSTKEDDDHGLLVSYLKEAKIAIIIGDNLFIHGAINTYNYSWIPPDNDVSSSSKISSNLIQWVDQINQWKEKEIDVYISNANGYIEQLNNDEGDVSTNIWSKVGGYCHSQPGAALLQYCMGWLVDKTINHSVIYASYVSTEVNSDPVAAMLEEESITNWYKNAAINHLFVGHQPVGDCPLVLSTNGIKVVCGDTSYGGDVLWGDIDNDGLEVWKRHHIENEPAPRNTRSFVVSDINIQVSENIFIECFDKRKTLLIEENNVINLGVASESLITEIKSCSSIVNVKGVLSRGLEYNYFLSDNNIGVITADNWIVKAVNVAVPSENDTKYYLLSKTNINNYTTKNKLLIQDNNEPK
jgi:hypothetical protein